MDCPFPMAALHSHVVSQQKSVAARGGQSATSQTAPSLKRCRRPAVAFLQSHALLSFSITGSNDLVSRLPH